MAAARTKGGAPATALPDLLLKFDVLTEALAGTEGTMSATERRRVIERRNALAAEIEELESKPHPSESEAARRARGLRVLKLRLPEEYIGRLDAICEESGYSRAEQIMGMIDAERDALARIRWRADKKKARSA